MPQAIASFVLAIVLTGCASLPPGSNHTRTPSTALSQPETTPLGKRFAAQAGRHPGLSGFQLLQRGIDSFLLRAQLVNAARRTVDIQYYIFAEDDTGKHLQHAILRAADRGVRVRLLIDDTNSFGTPGAQEILSALNDHRNIELRLFNPFYYRDDIPALRAIDAALNAPRVNRRMHNKLFVADNAVAIVGGRNVADAYYGAGSTQTVVLGLPAGAEPIRFGDFDVAAIGPIVPELSQTFDAYWNSALSVPAQALAPALRDTASLPEARAELAAHASNGDPPEIERRLASGEPLSGLLAGRVRLVWARASVVADPPEKAAPRIGEPVRSPIARALVEPIAGVDRDLVIVTPYFVPGPSVSSLIEDALRRDVRVRILTNSLASTDVPAVHGGYRKYRRPLVESGAELYEVRAMPGSSRGGSGLRGSGAASGRGSDAPFALHAKLYVYDMRRVFVGSANFDRRSFAHNTELGLMIDSPELARQIVARFDRFASSASSYRVVMGPAGPFGRQLRWRTQQDGATADLDEDPDATPWRRAQAGLVSLLPFDELL
jgi:putative cardiolipin synthase